MLLFKRTVHVLLYKEHIINGSPVHFGIKCSVQSHVNGPQLETDTEGQQSDGIYHDDDPFIFPTHA